MLPSVNTIVHLEVKVELEGVNINGLAEWFRTKREELLKSVFAAVVEKAQEQWLERVREGIDELVCTACGVVHRGAEGWVRRGSRMRKVKASSGELEFPLLQITCTDCEKTRAPCAEALGVEPRQQVTTELKRTAIERVYETSYHRSARTIGDCMGVRLAASTLHRYVQASAAKVELTPDPTSQVVLADGTKVRAGERVELEDLRMAFQVTGRSQRGQRRQAHLRLLGIGVGLNTWPLVLRGCEQTKLVVTDAEASLEAHVRERYPNARHQFCEWHVGHSLNYSLAGDRVALKERKGLRRELASILWRNAGAARKRTLYERFIEKLSFSPTSQKQLRRAASHILFETPSTERTTSLIERQMREVDRRVWIGVRWSIRGVRNLLLLSMARRHNPDDYERVWRT